MAYTFDFEPVWEAMPALLAACLGTLWLALAGMTLATIIGIAGVVLRDSRIRPVRWLVMAFVELIRNTPFLVQIYFIFFALPLIGVRLNPTPTAVIALGVNGGAYAIEIIRGGVQSIQKGQVEAGLALGLHRAQVFRLIVLRPALRAIYPSLTSQFILLTLTTSIALGDLRLRAHVGGADGREQLVPELRGLFRRPVLLPRDLVDHDADLQRDLRPLLQLPGQVRDA